VLWSKPQILSKRRLDVPDGHVGLLIQNGRTSHILDPGKHNVFNDLPMTGRLEYVLINKQIAPYSVNLGPFETADAARVSVNVTFEARIRGDQDLKALWLERDLERFSPQEMVEADVSAMASEVVARMAYDSTQASGNDAQRWQQNCPFAASIFSIERIMRVGYGKDEHFEELGAASQKNQIDRVGLGYLQQVGAVLGVPVAALDDRSKDFYREQFKQVLKRANQQDKIRVEQLRALTQAKPFAVDLLGGRPDVLDRLISTQSDPTQAQPSVGAQVIDVPESGDPGGPIAPGVRRRQRDE
jgi:SPFH domain / Band 7 family